MIGEIQKNSDGTLTISVKVMAQQVELLNAICNALGVNSYQIFQMFFYTLMRASSPMHELSPEIRKIMTLMECDASWANAFNLANPNDLDMAQCIMILQQKDKKGFGAVMIDKPFFDEARQTECVDDIVERVIQVTLPGIYKRLKRLYDAMDVDSLSELLLLMLDAQTTEWLNEQDAIEMKGEAMYDSRGRKIEYGTRTKQKQHRTPDTLDADQRFRHQNLIFDDFNRETGGDDDDTR